MGILNLAANSLAPQRGSISQKFVLMLFVSVVAFTAVIAGFVALADPYGVSPIKVARSGLNSTKLKRLNIDRQLKPYEVLRYQPDTVFIGTSRVNQSLDPAILDGARFGLSYNAAIPASTLSENEASLRLFFRLAPGIKNVLMEVFFYNFTRDQSPTPEFAISQVAADAVALQFSFQALRQAIETVQYNRITDAIPAHMEPRGYWVPDSWSKPGEIFQLQPFVTSIIAAERSHPLQGLKQSAEVRLDQIVALAKAHDVNLTLLVLPSHAWDDYRLLSLGHWGKLEDYYRLLARYQNVVSFTQPNEVTQEPARIGMRWWYDPVHPSLDMGRMALRALNGDLSGAPRNFMARITPEAVDQLLAKRKAAAKQWAVENPEFVEQFEAEKARVLH
ncbi:hypothetical protein [Bosea sp. 124]|uniref:hypothetical protein n=1 Tax=Bosea sp. 124 TaxID=2135642 RepID=UPI000D456AE9|nr:hypothetical protein [Bosea sp. 124]PTM40354.1 hypothetical protein C8D03_1870 [Bosea sp. 124]